VPFTGRLLTLTPFILVLQKRGGFNYSRFNLTLTPFIHKSPTAAVKLTSNTPVNFWYHFKFSLIKGVRVKLNKQLNQIVAQIRLKEQFKVLL
jgi:hypothetical protein